MKHTLAMTAALSLTAAMLIASAGSAQAPVLRASTERVTATTTPKRDRTPPYTFTTTGRIVPPGRFCAPGARPTPGAGNCIAIICPPGATDARYCVRPGISVICSGIVTVRLQRGTRTTSARNVGVKSNCTFRSRVSLRQRLRGRAPIRFKVRARFQGNRVLLPKNSSITTVRTR